MLSFSTLKARITMVSLFAVGALVTLAVFEAVMEGKLLVSERQANMGSEIAQRMGSILALENLYFRHPDLKYNIEMYENDYRIWQVIVLLRTRESSESIAEALDNLQTTYNENSEIYGHIAEGIRDMVEQKHTLAKQSGDLENLLNSTIENISLDGTLLMMNGYNQLAARSEFANVLKELLGYSSAVTLNLTNLFNFGDEESFRTKETLLLSRFNLLRKAGASLSRVTQNAGDIETWNTISSGIADIDKLRLKLYRSWEFLNDSVPILENSAKRTIMAAESINHMAESDFRRFLSSRSQIHILVLVLAGALIMVFGLAISRSTAQSLSRLRIGVEAIAGGDLDHRTGIVSMDELGSVSRAFDKMAWNLSVSHRNLEHEIVQRKAIQEGLQVSEQKYRDLFNHIHDPLVIVDMETQRIEDVNQIALDTFGYNHRELTMMKVADLAPPSEREKVIANVKSMKNEKISSKRIYLRTYKRKNGTTFPAEVTASVILINKYHKLIGSIRDVSERRLLESQLQQAEKLESLGVLAGGIAHDFNNILMGVVGNAGITLLKLPPDSPIRDNVRGIESAARRLSDLTAKLLAYSGKGKFESSILNLSGIAKEMSGLLEAVIPKEIEIVFDLDHGEPTLMGDSAQICQVVMNLITNATEASLQTKSRVCISTGKDSFSDKYLARSVTDTGIASGDYAYLTVSDTGHGIEPANIRKIFDPFFTTKDSGRGLGLAAVIGIVKAHHGALIVESEIGVGTTFRVLFPSATPKTGTSLMKTVPRFNAPPAAWDILVVDDEEIVRDVAKAILDQAGMNVGLATNGKEALEIYSADPEAWDLVLLDLSMPVMGGLETYQRLKGMNPDIRVIFTSGYDESESMSAFSHGEVSFIKKPYSPADLITKVRQVMDLQVEASDKKGFREDKRE